MMMTEEQMKELEQEALDALAELAGDQEQDHMDADAILCEVLEELGFIRLVAAYDKIFKWYA